MAMHQYPVEGARGDDQFLPAGGGKNTVDECIRRGVGNARKIAAARLRGSIRAEEGPELDARRFAHGEAACRDIEIEVLQAFLILCAVDQPHAGIDAQKLQVLCQRLDHPLEGGRVCQELEREGGLRRISEDAVLHGPSRCCQPVTRCPELLPVLPRAVREGRPVGLAEHLRRQHAAKRLKESQFRL